jgi:hypothetical protein
MDGSGFALQADASVVQIPRHYEALAVVPAIFRNLANAEAALRHLARGEPCDNPFTDIKLGSGVDGADASTRPQISIGLARSNRAPAPRQPWRGRPGFVQRSMPPPARKRSSQ